MLRKITTWLALCLVVLISGCAVLRVDVDVYKGPLANHKEVLYKNILFLADTSQILLANYFVELARQRKSLEDRTEQIGGGRQYCSSEKCESKSENLRLIDENRRRARNIYTLLHNSQFNWILENGNDIKKSDDLFVAKCKPSQSTVTLHDDYWKNVENLFSDSNESRSSDNNSENSLPSVNKQVLLISAAKNDASCNFEKLANFSEKLATLGNSTALELNGDRYGDDGGVSESVRYTALLQSLGNSIQIALHDYKQLAEYDENAKNLGQTERNAQQAMRSITPDEVYKEYQGVVKSKLEKVTGYLEQLKTLRDTGDALAKTVAEKEELVAQADNELKALLAHTDPATNKPEQENVKEWPAIWVYDAYTVLLDKSYYDGLPFKYVVLGGFSPSVDPKGMFENSVIQESLDSLGGKDKEIGMAALLDALEAKLTSRQGMLESKEGAVAKRRLAALARAGWYLQGIRKSILEAHPEKAKAQDVAKTMLKLLHGHLSDMKDTVGGKLGELKTAQNNLNQAKKDVSKNKAAQDKNTQEIAGDEDVNAWKKNTGDDAANLKAALQQVHDNLKDCTDDVLNEARKLDSPVNSGGMYVLMQHALDKKLQADGNKQELARNVVKTYLAVTMIPEPKICCNRKSSQVDVMDEVIAALRHELIHARKVGDGIQVKNLEAALREAYEQRSGMIYLRPAITYLRSTTTASILQEESGTTKRNLLVKDISDGIVDIKPKSPKERAIVSAREELDKQSWSNINSVKVSGGGHVNYALVKDDIGNWYVKGYSTDPGDIIRSVQGLGMFALGGKLNMNLLSAMQQEQELKKQLAGAVDGKEKEVIRNELAANRVFIQDNGAVNGIFGKFYALYRNKTQAVAKDVLALIKPDGNELKGRITAAWGDALAEDATFRADRLAPILYKALQDVKNDLNKQVPLLEETDKVVSTPIVDTVKIMRTFAAKIRDGINSRDSKILVELVDLEKKQSEFQEQYNKRLEELKAVAASGVTAASGVAASKALSDAQNDLDKQAKLASDYRAKVKSAIDSSEKTINGLAREILSKLYEAANEFETALIYLSEAASSGSSK